MKSEAKITFDRLPTAFNGLIKLHPPRPIHDETGYNNTTEMADAMAGHSLNEDQDDYLLLLATLIERYEAESLPKRADVSGLDLLRYLLDENELSGDDLARIIGVDRSVAYRILKGERGLTTDHIRRLCERFGVSADAFIRGGGERHGSAKYLEAADVAVDPIVREGQSPRGAGDKRIYAERRSGGEHAAHRPGAERAGATEPIRKRRSKRRES